MYRSETVNSVADTQFCDDLYAKYVFQNNATMFTYMTLLEQQHSHYAPIFIHWNIKCNKIHACLRHQRQQTICMCTQLAIWRQTARNDRRKQQSVFDLSGGWGFNPAPHWSSTTTPPTGDCKVWSRGRIWPPQKGHKSKFVIKSLWTTVRHYSDSCPKILFVMICTL